MAHSLAIVQTAALGGQTPPSDSARLAVAVGNPVFFVRDAVAVVGLVPEPAGAVVDVAVAVVQRAEWKLAVVLSLRGLRYEGQQNARAPETVAGDHRMGSKIQELLQTEPLRLPLVVEQLLATMKNRWLLVGAHATAAASTAAAVRTQADDGPLLN